MSRRTLPYAKLIMPKAAGAVVRARLFHCIDQVRERTSALWLSSPGGSGKTVLVSSYLRERKTPCLWFQMDAGDADLSGFFFYLGQAAPRRRKPMPLFTAEYHHDPRLFTRRFFEELFSRLKQASIIVFDNCETIAENEGLLQALALAVAILPDKVQAVFISRHELPKEFSGLTINGKIGAVGWDQMKITESEAEEFVLARGRPRTEARRLHEQSGGWMAGLVVMLEQTRLGGDPAVSAPGSRQALFDFFSHEIFGRMPEETRELLVKTAFLPSVAPGTAARLSGNHGAGTVLAGLSRKNFFTERLSGPVPAYQYHPLFREFLIQQAESVFPSHLLRESKKESAAVLAEAGECDAAVRLFAESGEYAQALELLLANAFPLISQGRNRTFLELLELLPQALAASSPWCGFWRGLATQPFDPARAREFFSDAFSLFKNAGDLPGMLRCWSSLVETVFHEWNDFTLLDPWIAWLDETSQDEFVISEPVLELQVASAMTAALTMRGGDPKKMRFWAGRAIRALEPVKDLYPKMSALVYCLNYVSWVRPLDLDLGIMETSVREAEKAELPPILRLTTIYTRAAMEIQRAPDMRKVIADVQRALSLAEETGVHVWDEIFYGLGVFCAVVLGQRDASAAFCEKMRACVSMDRKQGLAFYYYIRAWDRLAFGSPSGAREEIAKALQLYAQTGYEFPSNVATYGAAVICAENKELDQALAYALEADAVAEKFEALSMRYTTLLVLAYVRWKRGESREAVQSLAGALGTARAGKFYQTTWWWHGPMMSTLMELAIRNNIENDYAVELARRLKLTPADPATAPEAWPWPIRVSAFGGFEVLVEDKPLDQGRKSQQKPMALLKALAASGPGGANAGGLADLLWPEAEGDKAQHSLEMALHRLRKMLGNDESILSRDNRILLNRSLCGVDAFAFAEGLDSGLKALDGGRPDEARLFLEQALPLYKGHFLAGDGDADLSLSARERLRMKFLIGTEKLCGLYEKDEEDEKALDFYRRAVELDELSEELCRRYMGCCMKLGRRTEALGAYQRLERAMKRVMGLAPSEETKRVAMQMTD